MPKVYRLECNGYGVHNVFKRTEKVGKVLSKWLDVYEYYPEERPHAYDDFDDFERGPLFGCATLEQLRDWFNFRDVKTFDELLKCEGVELVSYTARKVIEGKSKKQIIFKPIKNSRKVISGTAIAT